MVGLSQPQGQVTARRSSVRFGSASDHEMTKHGLWVTVLRDISPKVTNDTLSYIC